VIDSFPPRPSVSIRTQMTTSQRLALWRASGAISDDQYNVISAIVRKDRFSVFLELNALLYIGVLALIAGIGWVIQAYVAVLGDAAIISALTAILLGCFYYCFSRATSYSPGLVESPTLAFDYVLYLGCLTFGIEIGYLETRFHFMQTEWDYYLLVSAGLFFALAYRFDNRFVLSLALSTLAGWFGIRMSRIGFFSAPSVRLPALLHGAIVIAAGAGLYRGNIKKHFTETYFHIAALVLFSALFSGLFDDQDTLYLFLLLNLASAAIVGGIRFKRFAFVVYGIAFGYLGISVRVLNHVRIDTTFGLTYLVFSGLLVIVFMSVLARRFGRDE
jgi:hypothetical protein